MSIETTPDVELSASQAKKRVAQYISERTALIKKLDKYKEFVVKQQAEEEPDVLQLKKRTSIVNKDFEKFETLQKSIEFLDSSEEQYTIRENYEEQYYEYTSKAENIISTNPIPVDLNQTIIQQPHVEQESYVKPPTFILPQFGGTKAEEWTVFSASFRSSIHNNTKYSNEQKLLYLRTCLTGKAAEKIQSLTISDANYIVAWEILEKNYFDVKTVINKHVQSFFNLPSCSKPSSIALENLLDEAFKNYKALTALNKPFWHAFPIYAITSKLDEQTKLKWMEHILDKDSPSMDDLLNFLHDRKKVLSISTSEKPNPNQSHTNNTHKNTKSHTGHNSTLCNTQSKAPFCHICKESHLTYACEKLINLTPKERFEKVKNAKLCLNCLRSNHVVSDCRSERKCKNCGKQHHTLLHFDSKISNTKGTANSQSSFNGTTAVEPSQVVLSTAVVHLLDKHGYPHACRALLDSGAQSNFITQNFANKLGVEQCSLTIPVIGINQVQTNVTSSINTKLSSRINNYSVDLSFLILPKITERLPSTQLLKNSLNIPIKYPLADPEFHKPSQIDILIGSEIFYKLLCVGQVELTPHSAVLQKTLLGWVVAGKVSDISQTQKTFCNLAIDPLHDQLEKFWHVEEVHNKRALSYEEEQCELQFKQTSSRNTKTGRYTVKLPFNDKVNQLGHSYDVALQRLYSLERSLDRKPDQKLQYHAFLSEYETLGHMSEIKDDDYSGVYLPHHAVTKQSSLTTKTRVVFDASAKTSSGISLNDTLMVGPTIQDDLVTILLRFRMHVFVLTADIEKMYRQVAVHSDDRKYQKILFRSSTHQPVKAYTLNTVTYGTSSAPFLATRALKQLALDESKNHPLAADVIDNDFYVDDLLTGAKTLSEAEDIRNDLLCIMQKGGFNLRQWASNEASLIENFVSNTDNQLMCLNLDETVKTLGISWNAQVDSIVYDVNLEKSTNKTTKRIILSQIARLYDPLGLLGPIITKAKLIMQDLWKLQLEWDESVSIEIQSSWSNFYSQLAFIPKLSITRKTVIENYVSLQLHGFGDACEKAYGACIYIRSEDKDGNIRVHLLCSKSRVAPLKTKISIDKLELCAAKLLAELYSMVSHSLSQFSFDKIILWSDSTITLHWIKTQPNLLKTFVSNRVSEIQKLTTHCNWFHVRSDQNPADMISRGLSPSELTKLNQFWFNGPVWLTFPEENWPIRVLKDIEITELRPVTVTRCLVTATEKSFLENYSSFFRLKRILAYCLRFIRNCRSKTRTQTNDVNQASVEKSLCLTSNELQHSQNTIFKIVQASSYSEEIKQLKSNQPLKSSITALTPFLDSSGLIRVGGRLVHSNLTFAQKHPVLLPSKHHITSLIIDYEHKKHLHAPTRATLNATRQYVWIVNGRNSIRNVLSKCITCFRAAPTTPDCIMGNLPKHRITFTRPFLQTGVDLCGPFYIKEKRHRNRNKIKVYVSIFVCFATRAVHIEIVEDLSSDAFLAALKRFCSRRGLPSDVYSDNATNFSGSKTELEEINRFINSNKTQFDLANAVANKGITWHFIPPRSPHFGGLWEAAVKSFKHHFIRTVGNTLLSYEALHTLTVEIEGILNSRPLVPLSSDPNDLQTLTPAHFLIGDSISNIPEYDFSDTHPGRLSSWQHTQQLKQHFWKRWRKEYLHELNTRVKWHKGLSDKLTLGQVVILHEDNVPVNRWKLGRISQLHPDTEGKVRVVTIKTSNGEYKRTIKKISPLPLQEIN